MIRSEPEKKQDSVLERQKALCGICPAGCWVEVGLENVRLVDIGADTDHTLGMIFHRGQYAPDIVYSWHRLKYPLRRLGPKGSYAFERISWGRAYGILVDNLERIKAELGAEAVAILPGGGLRSFRSVTCSSPRE